MSSGEFRPLWRIVFRNFINSFKYLKTSNNGKEIGNDYLGNAYFEIPPQPSLGKRKPTRWYTPPKGNDFEEPVPAEWEAWLRMRRNDPPTSDEIAKNLAIAQMKKENAAKLEEQRIADGGSLPSLPTKGPQSFPTYKGIYSSCNKLEKK